MNEHLGCVSLAEEEAVSFDLNGSNPQRCISCGSRAGASKGGTNLFVVHRRTETEMAVWLEDNPRDVVTVPLEPDRDSLKLETYFSVATFIRGQCIQFR